MKKTTFGFTVETDKDSIRISSYDDNHEIVISPHEVDGLITILKEAQKELLPDNRKGKKANSRLTVN